MFLTALKKGGGIQLVNRLFFCTAFLLTKKEGIYTLKYVCGTYRVGS